MFLISIALISLLLISGAVSIITSIDPIYQTGMNQKEIMDNITQNNDTIAIVIGHDAIMYFINYAKDSDMYCMKTDWLFGEDGERLHKVYNFTDYKPSDIEKVILNNTDKDIYLISWKQPKLNITTTVLDKGNNFVFSKVNTTGHSKLNATQGH